MLKTVSLAAPAETNGGILKQRVFYVTFGLNDRAGGLQPGHRGTCPGRLINPLPTPMLD
ncbi:hypothetical protein SAMN04487961_2149 [Marinobacter pelagius]|uniref:Uncharacterized protein n=1 Tax=Marinobacter pelagius TaxID=379482 RepID=A0A1I4W9L3_9GAMM|nr:hypothetical protein SAMN04487961_2149 [Marinobacter pelagius]